MAKKTGTFKTPSGQTITIRGDWVEDFGITDWKSLQQAFKKGLGQSGINATVNGQEVTLFPQSQAGSQGLRSGGRVNLGDGVFGVDTAGFLADHPNEIGPGSDLFNAFTLAAGGMLGGAGLMGQLGGGAGAAGGLGAETLAGIPTGFEGALASEFTPLAGMEAGAVGAGAAPVAGGGGVVNAGQFGLPSATGGAGGLATGRVGAGTVAGGTGAVGGLGGLLGGGTTFGIPNNILGGAVQGIGGYLAADKQGDAFKDVAAEQSAIGAPFRNLLLQSYQPGFNLWEQPGYKEGLPAAAEFTARQWAPAGNPANNPGLAGSIYKDVLNQSMLPALANYRGGLGQFGQLGLNTSGQASLMGANTTGSGWEAIGAGLNTALNPQPSLQDIFRQFGLGNQPNYSLNIGGMKLS